MNAEHRKLREAIQERAFKEDLDKLEDRVNIALKQVQDQVMQRLEVVPSIQMIKNCEISIKVNHSATMRVLGEQKKELQGFQAVLNRFDEVLCEKAQKHEVCKVQRTFDESNLRYSTIISEIFQKLGSCETSLKSHENTQKRQNQEIDQLKMETLEIKVMKRLQQDLNDVVKTLKKKSLGIDENRANISKQEDLLAQHTSVLKTLSA